MAIIAVIWDPDYDPYGNVQHIAEHDLTKEEVEEVLDNHYADYFMSRESPHNPITFGRTSTGRHIGVVFEISTVMNPECVRSRRSTHRPRRNPRKANVGHDDQA